MASNKKIRGWLREVAAFSTLLFRKFTGIQHDVPYLNQFGTIHRVREILDRQISPSALFPAWSSYGATCSDEFDNLSFESCGMACLSMILLHTGLDNPGPIELFRRSLEHGCYRYLPDGEIKGLYHEPFVSFLGTFGLHGEAHQFVGPYFIAHELTKGRQVIASVNWEIRETNPHPTRRGGHLVVITGVEKSWFRIRGFYIHNPSGTLPENQKHHFVKLSNFLKCFSGNIILVQAS